MHFDAPGNIPEATRPLATPPKQLTFRTTWPPNKFKLKFKLNRAEALYLRVPPGTVEEMAVVSRLQSAATVHNFNVLQQLTEPPLARLQSLCYPKPSTKLTPRTKGLLSTIYLIDNLGKNFYRPFPVKWEELLLWKAVANTHSPRQLQPNWLKQLTPILLRPADAVLEQIEFLPNAGTPLESRLAAVVHIHPHKHRRQEHFITVSTSRPLVNASAQSAQNLSPPCRLLATPAAVPCALPTGPVCTNALLRSPRANKEVAFIVRYFPKIL